MKEDIELNDWNNNQKINYEKKDINDFTYLKKDRNRKKLIMTVESTNDFQLEGLNSYNQNIKYLKTKIGFPNIGYSCYMNSFLQILFHTPFFLTLLKKNYNKKNEEELTLIDSLINLSENPRNIYILRSIKELMGKIDETFSKNIQKDSQYFGVTLLNEMIFLIKNNYYQDEDEENFYDDYVTNEEIPASKIEKKKAALFEDYIKKYFNKESETFIEKMFQFHESKIKIDKKQFSNDLKIKKIEFETFLNMDLFFPYENKQRYNIYDLLKNKYSNLSALGNELPKINNTKNNKYIEKFFNLFRDNNNENEFFFNNTNEIKTNNNFIIKRIYSLPNILIISINRMIIGKPFNKSKLIIQENIDLKEYLDENIDEENTTYSLYGINECLKIKEKFGHNFAYIKMDNKWFLFDDSQVLEKEPDFESEYVIGLYYVRDGFNDINYNI